MIMDMELSVCGPVIGTCSLRSYWSVSRAALTGGRQGTRDCGGRYRLRGVTGLGEAERCV